MYLRKGYQGFKVPQMFRTIARALGTFLGHQTDPEVDIESHRKTILLNLIVLLGSVFIIIPKSMIV